MDPCALFSSCGNFVDSASALCPQCVADLREDRREFYESYDKQHDEKGRDPREAFEAKVKYGVSGDRAEYLLLIDHLERVQENR